jgi:hypothetical protein
MSLANVTRAAGPAGLRRGVCPASGRLREQRCRAAETDQRGERDASDAKT